MSPLKTHLQNLPNNLVEALELEFQKLHKEYFLEHWEPSQLDGGRFAEVVFRILEYKDKGNFTAIGAQLKIKTIIPSVESNTSLPESLRFHILKLAQLIFDFRNKRNVGHLGKVQVNQMDATMVLQAANWIVAELIHLETQLSPSDAQEEIKKIIERKVPIIEEIGGRLKCLNADLKVKEKVLVFCYQKYPSSITLDDLFDWTEYSNKKVFSDELKKLSKESRIDYRNELATLTKLGQVWVEKNIKFELEV